MPQQGQGNPYGGGGNANPYAQNPGGQSGGNPHGGHGQEQFGGQQNFGAPYQGQGMQNNQQQYTGNNVYQQRPGGMPGGPPNMGGPPMGGNMGMGSMNRGGGGGAIAMNRGTQRYTPLNELSCYNNKWVIKARVQIKGDRRTFTNARGEGQLFSMDLVDESGGETRATFFNKAVDAFYDRILPGKVYTMSKGQVKTANKRFWSRSEYEITFEENSIIELCDDADCDAIPALRYDFKEIKDISNMDVGGSVDIKGVVVEVRDTTTVSLRSGGEKRKRSLMIADESDTKCEFTIWGEKADEFKEDLGTVVFIKNARIGDFGGRNLSSQGSTHIEFSPDDQRAFSLKTWYDQHGSGKQMTSISSGGGGGGGKAQTLAEVAEEDLTIGLSIDGKEARTALWHNLPVVYITHIAREHPPYYHACPEKVQSTDKEGNPNSRVCNKKTELIPSRSQYTCNANHVCDTPVARYILRLCLEDFTGQQYVTAFDEIGVKILQCSADQIHQLWSEKDNNTDAASRLDEIFSRANFTRWTAKIQSKKERYQEEDRLKTSLVEAIPVDVVSEGQRGLEYLNAL